MKFINLTIVKLSLCSLAGITLSSFYNGSITYLYYLLIASFCSILFFWLQAKKRLLQHSGFGLAVFFFFFFFGMVSYQLQLPKNKELHYSNSLISSETNFVTLKISEILKPSPYQDRYLAKVISINDASTSGKILLLISKDSTCKKLNIDEKLLLKTIFSEINKPKNPYGFNYANYMKTQDVYHQINVSVASILIHKKGEITLRGFAASIRDHIQKKIITYNFEADELAIINALLLGQKQGIDSNTKNDYAKAGAIHILAISGLHIGILLLILSKLFTPITYLKHGKHIKSVLLIICLWSFAIISGLSPSVIRAVTMFSLFSIAAHLDRPTNAYNTLFLSLFLLLLINPLYLFQVGFQLSYLAVFFILWLQPKLYNLYRPRFYIDKLFWNIITVSTAAQIGLLPLSLYYFHQFPGLFLLTNAVILPFLGVLLGLGILLLILASIDLLPQWFADFYGELINSLNVFVSWISQQESFLFEGISFTKLEVIVSYLIIICFIKIWEFPRFSRVVIGFASILLWYSIQFKIKAENLPEELVIFQKTKQTILGYKKGEELFVFSAEENVSEKNRILTDYSIGNNIQAVVYDSLPKVFLYKDQQVLLVDSLGIYQIPNFNPTIVILSQSPKINLKRLIETLNPELIIADGSNYWSYVARWKKTCKEVNIPFSHTAIDGAFVVD